jgi:hypothetical protein
MEVVNNSKPAVPYIVHEGEMCRAEKNIKRAWVVAIIAIIALMITNVFWIYAVSQYDYITYDFTTDGSGNTNYIDGDGVITNGTTESAEAS